MSDPALDLSQLPDRAEIEALLAPDVTDTAPSSDAWRTLERKLTRSWMVARGQRALGLTRRKRDVSYVQGRYENLWATDDLRDQRPKSVLEVGCGNGRNLFALAAMYPHAAYTGVELAEAGVAAAHALQAEPTVGEAIARHAPAPVVDTSAHQAITFLQGNAASLPFDDDSFDIACTILALEQMEAVRDQALTELARVARKLVVTIEPWRDLNDSGYRRDRIISHGYFSARVADLARFGLRPVHVDLTLPSKLQMGVALVVAAPIAR